MVPARGASLERAGKRLNLLDRLLLTQRFTVNALSCPRFGSVALRLSAASEPRKVVRSFRTPIDCGRIDFRARAILAPRARQKWTICPRDDRSSVKVGDRHRSYEKPDCRHKKQPVGACDTANGRGGREWE